MSRSCHSAWSSIPATAKPRRSRASPVRRSERIGLRLCGMADEPFWPARNGSWTSPISVCWRLRTSTANRSIEPPVTAIAVEERGVAVALDDLRADGVGREAEIGERLRLDLGRQVRVRPDRTGELAGREVGGRGDQSRPVAVELEGP